MRLSVDYAIAVVRATGREPKSYPANASTHTCDQGDGKDSPYVAIDTAAQVLDVTPDQAHTLLANIRDYLQGNGYGDLAYDNGTVGNIKVSASKNGISAGADYDLQDASHVLNIAAGTDCVFKPNDIPTKP